MSTLKKLVGLKIQQAYFDGDSIYLVTKDEKIVTLTPFGDCCAHCYVNGIDSTEFLEDSEILEVEDLAVTPTDEELAAECEVLDAWGHRLHTTRGIVTIDMRLSHNGYYGGELEVNFNKRKVPADAKRLLEDF